MLVENMPPVALAIDDDATRVRLLVGSATRIADSTESPAHTVHTLVADDGVLRFVLEAPLADAEGFWHPAAGGRRTLVPDWEGRELTSIVSSAPAGCLYDNAGMALLGFAVSHDVEVAEVRFGVYEEHGSFVVYVTVESSEPVELAVARPGRPFARVVEALRDWLGSRREATALPAPPLAVEPVYSTWYAFHQDLEQGENLRQAVAARELGCRSVFLDDGWQRLGTGRWYQGCGDWVPDPEKFPDLAAHVRDLHEAGVGVVLWVAPLLLGPDSDAHAELSPWARHFSDGLRAAVLDPRHPGVREHIIRTCLRLVVDFDLDGLKLDFLNDAMVYAEWPAAESMDVADVGAAMRLLLAALRSELERIRPDGVLLEFRQPYVGPAIGAYGNLLRAGDCPGDAVVNRRSTIDARLFASGPVIHSDMTMWDPSAPPAVAARQLFNAYFAVPQVSIRPADLPADHAATVRSILSRWVDDRETVLHGELTLGSASENYPTVIARGADRTVIGVYQPRLVAVGELTSGAVTILNATADDRVLLDVDAATTLSGRVIAPGGHERAVELRLDRGVNVLELGAASMLVGDATGRGSGDHG